MIDYFVSESPITNLNDFLGWSHSNPLGVSPLFQVLFIFVVVEVMEFFNYRIRHTGKVQYYPVLYVLFVVATLAMRYYCFQDGLPQMEIWNEETGVRVLRDNIGVLTGNKNTLTGIIDVAMVGSMYSKGNFNDFINSYGLVIMDECHHCGSTTSVEVMQKVNARYVYGVTATPKRGDNLEKIIHMLLGPIRHSYTAKERAEAQGIGHYVFPRFTRVIDTNETKNDINGAYNLISNNIVRSEMIAEDTRNAIAEGRKIVERLLEESTPHFLLKYKGFKGQALCRFTILLHEVMIMDKCKAFAH